MHTWSSVSPENIFLTADTFILKLGQNKLSHPHPQGKPVTSPSEPGFVFKQLLPPGTS